MTPDTLQRDNESSAERSAHGPFDRAELGQADAILARRDAASEALSGARREAADLAAAWARRAVRLREEIARGGAVRAIFWRIPSEADPARSQEVPLEIARASHPDADGYLNRSLLLVEGGELRVWEYRSKDGSGTLRDAESGALTRWRWNKDPDFAPDQVAGELRSAVLLTESLVARKEVEAHRAKASVQDLRRGL
jgi:hypothetical protein